MKAAVPVEVCPIPLVHLPKPNELRLGHNVICQCLIVLKDVAHTLSVISGGDMVGINDA